MSRKKQSRERAVRSIEAWTEQHMPVIAAAEREALEPLKGLIEERTLEILSNGERSRSRTAARQAPKVFHDIAAWEAHYLPDFVAARREAIEPFDDLINARVVEILVDQSKHSRRSLAAR